jgi:hypothetical protein
MVNAGEPPSLSSSEVSMLRGKVHPVPIVFPRSHATKAGMTPHSNTSFSPPLRPRARRLPGIPLKASSNHWAMAWLARVFSAGV